MQSRDQLTRYGTALSRDQPARYNPFFVATGFTPGFVSSDDAYPKIAGSTRSLQLILRSDWLYARIRIADDGYPKIAG